MFVDTRWDKAEDKFWFAKHFIRFVQSDFNIKLFIKKFYRRLINCFGNIAHYDIDGFYQTYFTTTKDKITFIGNCLQYPCYGDPVFTYSDVEKYLKVWLKDNHIIKKLGERYSEEVESQEREEYIRLKEKFG